MAATTEQLTALLGYDPDAYIANLRAKGVPEWVIADQQKQIQQKISAAAPTTTTTSVIAPSGQTVTPTQPFVTQGQAGQVNVPYGSDYLDPTLALYATMLGLASNEKTFGLGLNEDARQFDAQLAELARQFGLTFPEEQYQFRAGLGENQRQFNVNTVMNAAGALANLYAQGPYSAAELAFRKAGMGLPAIGGDQADAAGLFTAATRGASGNSTFAAGGQRIGIPNTLSGRQMAQLQGDPNLSGVVQSLAKAAGNPDIINRSAAALVPSGYRDIAGGLG